MQLLSLGACHMVVSHVACLPSSHVVEPPGQGAPMLHVPATLHWQAKTAPSPVGWFDAQPGGEGIGVPLGWLSAKLSDGSNRADRNSSDGRSDCMAPSSTGGADRNSIVSHCKCVFCDARAVSGFAGGC